MTLNEVATYLRCHPSTVSRLLKAGGLPAFRLGGDWRFLRSEIDKWIAGGQVEPPEEGRRVQPPERAAEERRTDRGRRKRGRKPKK